MKIDFTDYGVNQDLAIHLPFVFSGIKRYSLVLFRRWSIIGFFKMKRQILLTVFCLTISATVGQSHTEPLHVSLIQLIANPEKYDGKQVAVVGFLRLEFEGNALYLSQEDFNHAITRNAVWVDVTPAINKDAQILNNNYVALLGIFDASGHGHEGMFSGRLTKISRAAKWSDSKGHAQGESQPR